MPGCAPGSRFPGVPVGALRAGWSGHCGEGAQAGEDLGEQAVAGREPQDERPGVAYQPCGDGDETAAEGGDHGFAAAGAVPFQDLLAAGGGGELVQPGGYAGGEQRAPHPGGISSVVFAGHQSGR
jgi:hypothetical protein